MAELCDLVRQAVWTVMLVAAPMLVVGVLVAAVVGLIQAATGIHDPVLALIPRLAAMAAVLVITLPWMAERLVDLFVHAAVPPS